MTKNISDDLFLAIRPLLYVSRALGLAPFAYVKKTLPRGKISLELELSSAAFIYSVFVVVLNVFLFLSSIMFKDIYVFSHMAETDVVTDILLHTTSITSLVSLALSVVKNKNAVVRIMLLVAETDSIILTCSREYYRKANIRINIQLLVIGIFAGFTLTYDSIIWSTGLGLKIFAYCHMYIDALVEWIVVIQFVNMVVLLKDRYCLLNTRISTLSGIFEMENSKKDFYLSFLKRTNINVKEMKAELTSKEILNFNNFHDTLFDTVLLVNSTYELQIFLSLLSTFVGITIRSYFGLCHLYGYLNANSTDISATSVVLSHMLWCSIHVAKLLCITVPCHSANNKMAQTATVLRKILLASHADPATVTELERFSRHLALRKFKFTVFGFLSLDLSLLFSMMGAVATYLVILMQFKISINSVPARSKNVTD
jgi:hypothetical protein